MEVGHQRHCTLNGHTEVGPAPQPPMKGGQLPIALKVNVIGGEHLAGLLNPVRHCLVPG
jgi:hypothetical protein